MQITTVQVLVAIATILCGGIIAAIVTYRLNRDKERINYLRDKLEELYMATSNWISNTDAIAYAYKRAIHEENSVGEAIEMISKRPEILNPAEFLRSKMIVELYFRGLIPKFNELLRVKEMINEIIREYRIDTSEENTQLPRLRNEIANSIALLDQLERDFMDNIYKLSSKIQ